MDIEDIDKILNYETIKKLPTPNPNEFFDRHRYFEINGKTYHITWWKNVSYFYADTITIPFNKILLTNTWPDHSKMNLQLYDSNNNICGIISIDSFKEKGAKK